MGNIEKAELTVMCMICDGTKILVQDRVNKDWPGVTFPGGHVEPGEAFTDAVRREVKEETGLDISRPTVCGINDFVRDDGTRYIVLFFRADRFSGELQSEFPDGPRGGLSASGAAISYPFPCLRYWSSSQPFRLRWIIAERPWIFKYERRGPS